MQTNNSSHHLLSISCDVWKYQILPYVCYSGYVSLKRTCRFLYKMVMASHSSSFSAASDSKQRSMEKFYKFCRLMHTTDHNDYLFTYLQPINVMPFSCRSSSSLPDYARVLPALSPPYYLNWEEFEYMVEIIPHNELKRMWDNFVVNPIFRARLIISEIDSDGISEKIVSEILLQSFMKDPRKFNPMCKWISCTLPNLVIQISDVQDLMFELILNGAPTSMLSHRLRHDKSFIMHLLNHCNSVALNELEEEFQYDLDVVIQSVSNDPNNYTFLSNSMRSERLVTIQMIRNANKIKDFPNNNKAFVKIFEKYVPLQFRSDREVMKLSLQQDSSIMPYVSDQLKNDKEFVMNALKISTTCFPHTSLEMRSDPEVCLLALRNSNSKSNIMSHMNCLLLYDEDFMREIVSMDGMLLSFAPSTEITQNRTIVLTAVKQNGFALEHADKLLRNDVEIVRAALMQDAESIAYASESCRDNFELMSLAVQQSKIALMFCSERLREDVNLVCQSISQHPSSIQFASGKLLQNSQFIEKICPQVELYIP